MDREGGSGLGFLAVLIFVVLAVVAVIATPQILGDMAANRKVAESQARAAELQAQSALEAQRAQTDAERSERSHRQALETLPFVALIVGGVIVLAVALVLGIPFAMRLLQQQPVKAAPPQLPAPPTVYVIMAGDRPRADQWREIERQAHQHQVTIYQDERD